MKNNWLRTVLVSILAVCVLVSTSSFTVNKRFCGDSLIEASIFAELKQCKKTTCTTLHVDKEHSQKVAENCCKKTSDVIYGHENLGLKKYGPEKIKLHKKQVITATQVFSGFLRKNNQEKRLVLYEPPLLPQKNLLQYYQVFLI